MKNNLIKNGLMVSAVVALPLSAIANESNFQITPETISKARCFQFEVQSPERDFHFEQPTETGCYLQLDENRELVFLKSADGVDKFTSALTTKTDKGFQLAHFSQTMGTTTKALQKEYVLNPLPVPPTLEEALDKVEGGIEVSPLDIYADELRDQLSGIVESYYDKTVETVVVDEDFAKLPEGDELISESFYLPESRQPADGYWWPHTGVPMANGPESPLAKYDRYVESVTGKNPRAYDWERANHFTDTFWAGHCNGWVASSILYGYDGKDLYDPKTKMTINASDLQGLRTATSYCVSNMVMGNRYQGAGSDVADIHPDMFHKNLEYYVRLMKKPMAMDYLSMLPVDNHIISGYQLTYESAGNRRYLVTARLKVHGYNYTKVYVNQVAKPYELTYKYYLWKDDRGRPVGGRWVNPKDHPDFVWIPLSQKKCGGENPRMDHKYVEHMIQNLRNTRPQF